MDKVLKLLEKYVEWIAVALAALWVGWIVSAYVMKPPTVNLGGEEFTAATIDDHIADGSQRILHSVLESTDPFVAIVPITTIGEPLAVPPEFAMVPVGSDPAYPLNAPKLPGPGNDNPGQAAVGPLVQRLSPPPKPGGPTMNQGVSNVMEPGQANGRAMDKPWATIFATMNRGEIAKQWAKENVKDFLLGDQIRYLRVELERAEVIGGQVVPEGDARRVLLPQLPFIAAKAPAKAVLPASQVWIDQNQLPIVQPAFYNINQGMGDPWFKPDANTPANKVNPLVAPAAAAGGAAVPPPPIPQAPGVANQIAYDEKGNFDIWQHDDSAMQGKTYRYRIRLVVKNPMYNSADAGPDLKNQFEIEGVWSEWSDAFAVPQLTRWFVVNHNTDGTIDVRSTKFVAGRSIQSPLLKAAPGDVIGANEGTGEYSTGATLIDVRSVGIGSNTTLDKRITILNTAGQIEVRSLAKDKADAKAIEPKPEAAAPK